jgi:hypothetical protein
MLRERDTPSQCRLVVTDVPFEFHPAYHRYLLRSVEERSDFARDGHFEIYYFLKLLK